jgi:hypothetical protein
MNTTFWLNNPTILFKSEYIKELYPINGMTSEQKLNAITRLIILLTILGYLVTQRIKIVITGVVTLGVIVILYYTNRNTELKNSLKKTKNIENFENLNNEKMNCYNVMKQSYTQPTPQNPVMNVLLTEIHDNPERLEGAPAFNKVVENTINDNAKKFIERQFGENSSPESDIDKKLFKDLGDSFEFEQSMRNFYVTPNTKIPNDQASFADFCYGDMISCKEGDPLACVRNNPRYNNY